MKIENMSLSDKETLYKKALKRLSIIEKLEITFFSLTILAIFVSSLLGISIMYRGYAILYSLGIGTLLGLICTLYAKIEGSHDSKLAALIEKDKSNR